MAIFGVQIPPIKGVYWTYLGPKMAQIPEIPGNSQEIRGPKTGPKTGPKMGLKNGPQKWPQNRPQNGPQKWPDF